MTCYVGLHHMTAERLKPFLASVARILRPGGVFIVRDHDVDSDDMRALVSLAHTVFNAGLGETWEANRAELRFFESADTWVRRLHEAGFDDRGHRLLQDNDPTQNALFCFEKRGAATPPRRAATRPCLHEPDGAATLRPRPDRGPGPRGRGRPRRPSRRPARRFGPRS